VFTDEQFRSECALVRAFLEKQKQPHWREFLQLWNEA
jgi:hypothetical protein